MPAVAGADALAAGAAEAPVAEDDLLAVPVNGSADINVLGNDRDPDGTALQVVSATAASHGTLQVYSNGAVHYTPSTGYAGPDSFTYTIENEAGERVDSAVDKSVDCAFNPVECAKKVPVPGSTPSYMTA